MKLKLKLALFCCLSICSNISPHLTHDQDIIKNLIVSCRRPLNIIHFIIGIHALSNKYYDDEGIIRALENPVTGQIRHHKELNVLENKGFVHLIYRYNKNKIKYPVAFFLLNNEENLTIENIKNIKIKTIRDKCIASYEDKIVITDEQKNRVYKTTNKSEKSWILKDYIIDGSNKDRVEIQNEADSNKKLYLKVKSNKNGWDDEISDFQKQLPRKEFLESITIENLKNLVFAHKKLSKISHHTPFVMFLNGTTQVPTGAFKTSKFSLLDVIVPYKFNEKDHEKTGLNTKNFIIGSSSKGIPCIYFQDQKSFGNIFSEFLNKENNDYTLKKKFSKIMYKYIICQKILPTCGALNRVEKIKESLNKKTSYNLLFHFLNVFDVKKEEDLKNKMEIE